MPKPRKKFPYWDLAKELEAEEEISLPEAVQRVVESAVEDAVDGALGHLERGFRSVRTTKADLKKAREIYRKHHPRENHHATPAKQSKPVSIPVDNVRSSAELVLEPPSVSEAVDELKETIERWWPPTGARPKKR